MKKGRLKISIDSAILLPICSIFVKRIWFKEEKLEYD